MVSTLVVSKLEDFVGYLGTYLSPVKSIVNREKITIIGLVLLPVIFLLFKAIILGLNGFTFYGDVSLPVLNFSIQLMLVTVILLLFSILSYYLIEAIAFVISLLMLYLVYSFYGTLEMLTLFTIYAAFFYKKQKNRKKEIWRE